MLLHTSTLLHLHTPKQAMQAGKCTCQDVSEFQDDAWLHSDFTCVVEVGVRLGAVSKQKLRSTTPPKLWLCASEGLLQRTATAHEALQTSATCSPSPA